MDTMRQRILVVDDDPSLAEMLTIVLRGEGFDTAVIGDGTQALTAVRELRPDLVLLDLMLPGMNGIDVCRVLRADSGVPIVMLTAKTDTVDVVLGLESGADDYVVKPFAPRELVARLQANLRRAGDDDPGEPAIQADGLEIDLAARTVRRDGAEVHLTPIEFGLLRTLARQRGRLMTHRALLVEVWGPAYVNDTQVLRTHIANLRRKIEPPGEAPRYIRTDPGVGYRFVG
jgi:two-component system response regulator MtrA